MISIVNKILKFQVKDQHLKRIDETVVVNKLKNILVARFDFKEGWDDLNVFAIFKNENKSYCLSVNLEDNIGECVVPWEVLQGRWFKLTLFGGNLLTTNEITIYLSESGYTTDVDSTSDPSPDIFVELFEKFDEKADVDHTHNISDVNNLDDELASIHNELNQKSNVGHNHTSNDVTDFAKSLETEIDEDLELLLLNLSEKINEI